MRFTENFNLNLPNLDDISDIEKVNENFEKIDELIKENESDPALEAKVEEINNKIGTESDADTQPTLFGRLAQLKNVLLEKLAEVLTKVTGIDGKIGTSGDSKETQTLFGKLQKILYSTEKDNIELVPSDNVRATLYTSPFVATDFALVIKRKAEHSGVIKVKFKLYNTQGSNSKTKLVFGSLNNIALNETISSGNITENSGVSMNTILFKNQEGDVVDVDTEFDVSTPFLSSFANSSSSEAKSLVREIYIPVEKGEYYILATKGFTTCTFKDVTICYDEKEVS